MPHLFLSHQIFIYVMEEIKVFSLMYGNTSESVYFIVKDKNIVEDKLYNNFQINISKYAFRATGLILSRNYMYISTETLFSLKPSKEAFINAVIIPPEFRIKEIKRKVKEFMDNNLVILDTIPDDCLDYLLELDIMP